ncbi:MAG: hypothetical protein AM326_01155 [Candidatus Thorarchaeota archaeon SMTZ-45]|nr:MAG: hypothetical protein AM326_01155 [Candidatus Thorarchaeota archaeon SMTZ-45]
MFIEISGFLFLTIIVVLVLATSRYGYEIFSELNADAQLQKISEDPQKFRTGTVLVVMEHVVIISLAVMLFIAFSPINLLLGVVWVVARGTEGLIQIYTKRRYWGLLNIAGKYSGASVAEKDALVDSGLSILKSKNSTFSIAQILFSIGTLSYSILFVTYVTVVPAIIGWFGIVASIIYGVGNGLTRVRPDSKALWNLGGLLIWIFELVLGGWLLFIPRPPPPVPL